MSAWKHIDSELPPIGMYVLGKYNGGNWNDSEDPEGACVLVVKRVKGRIESNNERPYRWNTFGPGRFFGQDIEEWAWIPD